MAEHQRPKPSQFLRKLFGFDEEPKPKPKPKPKQPEVHIPESIDEASDSEE